MQGANIYSDVSDRMETATSLPPAAFLDRAVFEAETDRIFRRQWMPVARVEQLAKAGDFLTLDLAGVPLVVSRDEKGSLHALSRVCRHRSMPVAEGEGNAKAFTCPYHLWRYGLDGRLLSAPAMDRSEVFDRDKCGLPSYPVDVWEGFVFVNLDADAEPLAACLEGLKPLVTEDGLADMRIVSSLTFPSPWNWKVLVENFIESYHHIGPHAESLQQSNPAFGTYVPDLPEGTHFTVLENPPVEGADPFSVYVGFPAFLLVVLRGETTSAVWYRLDIRDEAYFDLTIHILMKEPEGSDAELVAGTAEVLRHIHMEDIAVCDGVQAGLSSPAAAAGPLSHLERGLWHFHRYLKQMTGNG